MKNIKSISKLSIQVILPLLGVMAGLYILLFQSVLEAKSLIYRHIEDTAQLYAEQISQDIIKINYDIINSMNTNQKLYFERVRAGSVLSERKLMSDAYLITGETWNLCMHKVQ